MDIPDFSRPKTEPLRFRIDQDVFECAATLPAAGTRLLVTMAAAGDATIDTAVASAQLSMLGDFLDMVLMPESAKRFAERMGDPGNPINDDQISAVLKWLVEQYGQRPTMPPTASDGGRPATGELSTAGVSPSAED